MRLVLELKFSFPPTWYDSFELLLLIHFVLSSWRFFLVSHGPQAVI